MEGNTFNFAWEVALMERMQANISPAAEKLANACSFLGEELILILILGFLYWCYDKQMGKRVALGIACGLVWNPMIKNFFLRRRPYFDHKTIRCLRPVDTEADLYDIQAQQYSFPSGHSTNSVLAYGGIAFYKKHNRILWIFAFVLPVIVGISRVLTGNHYPTDVIGGWLLGIFIIAILNLLYKYIEKEWIIFLILFLTGVPGFFYCRSTDYFTGMGLMAGAFPAILFEEHFVNFKSTKKPLSCLLRLAGGALIYLILNILLKMPFSSEFLLSHTMASFMVRFFRYFTIIFILLGVYPIVFNKPGRESIKQ